jgi:hypothetical protein
MGYKDILIYLMMETYPITSSHSKGRYLSITQYCCYVASLIHIQGHHDDHIKYLKTSLSAMCSYINQASYLSYEKKSINHTQIRKCVSPQFLLLKSYASN